MPGRTLTQYLLDIAEDQGRPVGFAQVLSAVAVATKVTAALVSRGSLIVQTSTTARPDQRSANRGLRQQATQALLGHAEPIEQLAAISLSGSTTVHTMCSEGQYLLLFEALHGLSNLSDNLPVGSAFSVLERAGTGPVTPHDFLQPGTKQLCAGIAVFGPRTVLTLTTGRGVDSFTLDRDVGNFVLTQPQQQIPVTAPIFAVNATDAPYWPTAVKRYVDECVQGAAGPRGVDFRMRWNASALVGAYRVLNSGGLFLVPDTGRPGAWLAPLLHNAAPLAFLAEQAGGAASIGTGRALEVMPGSLTDRVPFYFGSTDEVRRIESYFTQAGQHSQDGYNHPLFQTRTLFVD